MSYIAGVVPFTTIDYPDHLSAVIFFAGCPLKCPYCHNASLRAYKDIYPYQWTEILDFLKQRQGLLEAVVFSGGEPLMQQDLYEKMQDVKNLSFKVGVHTSGFYSAHLEKLLPLLDWVGLDIKAPWEKYVNVSSNPKIVQEVQTTLKLLLDAGIDFEARTTADPSFLTPDDILTIGQELSQKGVKNYALQLYRPFKEALHTPTHAEIRAFADKKITEVLTGLFSKFTLRND